MKHILFAVLMSMAAPALACEINRTGGLDDVAVQKLKMACEQAKLDAKQAEADAQSGIASTVANVVTTERVSAFGLAAKDVAAAVGIAARELGLAVNEFLSSPAGMLVAAVVIWKMFAIQFIGIIGVIVVMCMGWWFIRRSMVDSYEVVEKKRLWGAYTVTKRVPIYAPFNQMSDSQGLAMVAAAASTAIVTWVLLAQLVIP